MTPPPIKDHKIVLLLSSAFILFSHRKTRAAHISSVTFTLAYIEVVDGLPYFLSYGAQRARSSAITTIIIIIIIDMITWPKGSIGTCASITEVCKWYEHVSEPVVESSDVKILWDFIIQTE